MLESGYLHVQNTEMAAQVHLHQLYEYKWMIHQAIHNILYKETSLYQLLLDLNLCHFELVHLNCTIVLKYRETFIIKRCINVFFMKTVGLFFLSVIQ